MTTEIRPTKHGLGVFALQEFAVGDVIMEETKPIARLGLASDDELLASLRTTPVSSQGLPKDDKESFWHTQKLPSEVDPVDAAKFRGLVQAAVCFAASLEKPYDKLFELYHPSLSNPTKDEEKLMDLSKISIKFLKDYARKGTKLKEFLQDLEQCESVLKMMLIWACNAFEGGRVYEHVSRINHSCNPNAVIQVGPDDQQIARAVTEIHVGDEVTISYLGSLLYADQPTRKRVLLQDKYFECCCTRCTTLADRATSLPCPFCHPRMPGQRQLDEEVQYDDELTVHYMYPPQAGILTFQCDNCLKTFDCETEKVIFQSLASVTDKVVMFLRTDDATADGSELQAELLEEHLRLASSVLGARHWTTNLLMLRQLDVTLQNYHGQLLSGGGGGDSEPDTDTVAEAIDMLERLFRFLDGLLELKLHPGHLLTFVVIGVARALVGFGDTKSQKYAAEWLDKIVDYSEKFESEGIRKVVATLRNTWKSDERGGEIGIGIEPPAKRPKEALTKHN